MNRVLSMQVNRTVGRCQGIAARAVTAIAAVMVAGCVTPGEATRPSVSSATIRYIEPAEARDLQISRGAQVVSIGEQVNFDRRRIADSIWIPIDKLKAFASDAPGKVIVYDSGFGAVYSDAAQPVLGVLGDRIRVIKGGLAAWERAGLPVASAETGAHAQCVAVRVNELRRALEQADDFIVIDLRRREDYDAVHIQGSIWALAPETAEFYKQRGKHRWLIAMDQSGLLDAAFFTEMARQGIRYCGYVVGGYDAWAGRPGRTAAGR